LTGNGTIFYLFKETNDKPTVAPPIVKKNETGTNGTANETANTSSEAKGKKRFL